MTFPGHNGANTKGVLAAGLSGADWDSLSLVYSSLLLFEDEAGYKQPEDDLLEDDLEHIRMTREATDHALSVLLEKAGVPERERHGGYVPG